MESMFVIQDVSRKAVVSKKNGDSDCHQVHEKAENWPWFEGVEMGPQEAPRIKKKFGLEPTTAGNRNRFSRNIRVCLEMQVFPAQGTMTSLTPKA